MTTHTPGPWIAHKSKSTFAIQSEAEPHAGLIAHVYAKGDLSADQSSYSKPEEAEANAKLIVASPDMLAALVDAEANLAVLVQIAANLPESGDRAALIDVMNGRLVKIRAAIAIARAEGK